MKSRCRFFLGIYILTAQFQWLVAEVRVLTYEEVIHIALQQSYTIKSYLENKIAMEHYFNYYKAMFKPRLDFSIFAPSWSENVIPIQRPDGLPVYNSYGLMQYGGTFQFTYIIPTGGNFALSSQLYREQVTTVLAQQNFLKLKSRQAYSSLNLSFNQPIFTTNTLKENLTEARYLYEQSSSQFNRGQMDIIYQVSQSFYDLYRVTRQVEIARDKLSNSEEALRIARLKGETGRIPEGDVLIAEVAAARNQAELSESVGKLQRAKDLLKQLIGLDLDQDIQIVTDLRYDTLQIDPEKAIASAFKNRLEIFEADLAVKLQKIKLDRAERVREFKGNVSAYYDLTGVSTLSTGSSRDLFESSFDNFIDRPPNRGITFTLSYPIYDWGRGSAQVEQEMAHLREANLAAQNTRTSVIREVRDVVRSVNEAKNRLEINEKNQKLAERSYAISRMRFENGDITSQELGMEQERLAATQIDYLNAFITYQMALVDLKRKTMWDFQSDQGYRSDQDFIR